MLNSPEVKDDENSSDSNIGLMDSFGAEPATEFDTIVMTSTMNRALPMKPMAVTSMAMATEINSALPLKSHTMPVDTDATEPTTVSSSINAVRLHTYLKCDFCGFSCISDQKLKQHIKTHISTSTSLGSCEGDGLQTQADRSLEVPSCSEWMVSEDERNQRIKTKGVETLKIEVSKADQYHVCTVCNLVFLSIGLYEKHKNETHATKTVLMQLDSNADAHFDDSCASAASNCPETETSSETVYTCLVCRFTCPNLNDFSDHMIDKHAVLRTVSAVNSSIFVKSLPYYPELDNDVDVDVNDADSRDEGDDGPKPNNDVDVKAEETDSCHENDCPEPNGDVDVNAEDIDSFHENDCPEPNSDLDVNAEETDSCHEVDFTEAIDVKPNKKYKGRKSCKATKSYVCDFCDKICNSKQQLQRHYRVHKTPKIYVCHVCGRTFKYAESYRIHADTHIEKTFACDQCHKSYSTYRSMVQHKETHSEIKRQLVCHVCGKTFSTPTLLRSHSYSHNTERSFSCDQCDKSYTSPHMLARHKRGHLGVSTLRCDFCGKQFNRKYSLDLHRKTHTKEKPHACSICGKAFIASYTLRRHMRVHTNVNKRNAQNQQTEEFIKLKSLGNLGVSSLDNAHDSSFS